MSYVEMQYKSEALGRAIVIQVILPSYEGFEDTKPPYKTLYFLHGIGGNAKELIQFINLRPQTILSQIAIVMIDGDNSLYADRGDGMNNYRKLVEEEIVKVTRKTFPLSPKRDDTFIGGISMGGHGAFVAGITKSDLFSKIALLSPAIDFYDALSNPITNVSVNFLNQIYGSKETYVSSDVSCNGALEKAINEKRKLPKVFMSWGNQDPLVLEQDRDFVKVLKEKGVEIEALEMDGNHDIFLWDKQLEKMFDFLKKEDGKNGKKQE